MKLRLITLLLITIISCKKEDEKSPLKGNKYISTNIYNASDGRTQYNLALFFEDESLYSLNSYEGEFPQFGGTYLYTDNGYSYERRKNGNIRVYLRGYCHGKLGNYEQGDYVYESFDLNPQTKSFTVFGYHFTQYEPIKYK